tara:strand:- start:90 stop:1358 length:1269 start_codon:yes stop_codon:yes gene_type:complete
MKNKFKFSNINNQYIFIFFILYLTVLLGIYFNEDNLGGATHDSIYHFKIVQKFNENFFYTFSNFGKHELGLGTRNSPVFWAFMSLFSKYISFDLIRVLNSLIIFPTAIFFYKCLIIKFKNFNHLSLIILTSMIFLSPSLRSITVWPYSLSWGLFFFILSIYYYLKFQNNLNLKRSLLILTNIIFAAYIYPSFSVFYIFYFFKIINKTKSTVLAIKILFLSFILSLPCIIYLISTDFLKIFQTSQGVGTPVTQSLNISNKILIIGTMILYFLMPIVNIKEVFLKIKTTNKVHLFLIFIFCLINIYFFNFPHSTWGGGFFHKASNIIFDNNYLFFVFSILSILTIYSIIEKNFNNYLLLIILILFNPQLTIYVKYFDPLIFILFLTLFDFDLKKHFFEKTYAIYQFCSAIFFYYVVIYLRIIFF